MGQGMGKKRGDIETNKSKQQCLNWVDYPTKRTGYNAFFKSLLCILLYPFPVVRLQIASFVQVPTYGNVHI